MAYEVRLNMFEGPLDLLLHLIEKAEVDIYDIPITLITEQYMQYLYIMQEFQLDIASEFLVMAATLLEIKSKMLLPKKEEKALLQVDDSDVEAFDPRVELMERLLEYKKYKQIAEELREREVFRSKLYTRPAEDLTAFVCAVEENPVANVTLYDMVGALTKVLKKAGQKARGPEFSKIHHEEISVQDKIMEITNRLKGTTKVLFSELFSESPSKSEIVTTFMAVLELMKKCLIICEQTALFDDIYITAAVSGERGNLFD